MFREDYDAKNKQLKTFAIRFSVLEITNAGNESIPANI